MPAEEELQLVPHNEEQQLAVADPPPVVVHGLVPLRTEQQNFSAIGQEAGRLCSHSMIDCTITIAGSKEALVLPVQICTKIQDVKEAMCARLGYMSHNELTFVVKQGCTYKTLLDSDQVARKMIIRGIKSFKAPIHKYQHPYGIIGAGYNGIKTALFMEKDGQKDYVIFDRYHRVSGHAWLDCANKTTRLQTEFSCYHVWYGAEWSNTETTLCGGAPVDWEIWPSADRVIEHFEICAREYGIMAHCRLNTDIEYVELRGRPTDLDRHFYMHCAPKVPSQETKERRQGAGRPQLEAATVPEGAEEQQTSYVKALRDDPSKEKYIFTASCVAIWPGNLINPRHVQYSGEELFGGHIEYGVEMRFDYSNVVGKRVIVHGHGAFTMENIRTCCEYGAKKIYVVCRKRNMTCPRVVSWFINQADPPITGVHCLNMLTQAYKLANYDPWEMHSVSTNSNRTHVTLSQTTRFGIGDIYFLSAHYGIMEVVVGNIKRCSYRTVHMEDGDKLEDIDVVLKCLGMLPDWTVDRVMRCKFMKGFWINGDPRRFSCADPNGIFASNFAATTIGPGAYGWIKIMKHFWDCPGDWAHIEDTGLLAMIPVHSAGEPEPDTPAYFLDAKHAQSTSILIMGLSPLLAEKARHDSAYKHWIANYCSPADKFLAACKEEWDFYEKLFREKDMIPKDTPYTEYIYSLEYIEEQRRVHARDMQRLQESRTL